DLVGGEPIHLEPHHPLGSIDGCKHLFERMPPVGQQRDLVTGNEALGVPSLRSQPLPSPSLNRGVLHILSRSSHAARCRLPSTPPDATRVSRSFSSPNLEGRPVVREPPRQAWRSARLCRVWTQNPSVGAAPAASARTRPRRPDAVRPGQ